MLSEGKRLYAALLEAATAFDRRLTAGLDEADLAQLRELLARLAANADS